MKTTYFNPDAEIGRFHTDAISQRRLVQADALPSQRPCNFASWIVCSQESVLLFSRKLASFCQLKSLLLEQGIDRGWNRKSNEKSQSASPSPVVCLEALSPRLNPPLGHRHHIVANSIISITRLPLHFTQFLTHCSFTKPTSLSFYVPS